MENIKINNLSFAYEKNNNILNNINLNLEPGKFYLLSGPTGCGKSTLLKLLANLYPKFTGKITSGSINWDHSTYAMMFQNPSQQFTMATAREEIIFALENMQKDYKDYEQRLKKAIKFTQIENLLDQKISTMSGGEKQRVALAVLIAMDVDYLILDEPFASCDPESRTFLINKLNQLKKIGKTIILSDHNLNDYQKICDEILQYQNNSFIFLSKSEKNKILKQENIEAKLNFSLPSKKDKSAFILNQASISQNRLLLNQKSLSIPQDKITLITGANGIGKSSFFDTLTKIHPYSGSITYQNNEISKLKSRKYLLHVAQVFQKATDQFLSVTVNDEINLSKKLQKNKYFSDEKINKLLQLLKLDTHLEQVVYSLSGGQQKKLQILLMLISGHDVLLFDEPLSGLDKNSSETVLKLIKETQKNLHQTILIISHQLQEMDKWCDYHLVFANQQLTYVEN